MGSAEDFSRNESWVWHRVLRRNKDTELEVVTAAVGQMRSEHYDS